LSLNISVEFANNQLQNRQGDREPLQRAGEEYRKFLLKTDPAVCVAMTDVKGDEVCARQDGAAMLC
jgi:hypothetical protein